MVEFLCWCANPVSRVHPGNPYFAFVVYISGLRDSPADFALILIALCISFTFQCGFVDISGRSALQGLREIANVKSQSDGGQSIPIHCPAFRHDPERRRDLSACHIRFVTLVSQIECVNCIIVFTDGDRRETMPH